MSLLVAAEGGVLVGKSPIVGTSTEADAASRTLARMVDEIDSGNSKALQSVSLLRTLSGKSVTKLKTQIDTGFMQGATQLSLDLSTASSAFAAYADDINRIHASARETISTVEDLLSQIRGCARELEQAARTLQVQPSVHVPTEWNRRPSLFPPAPSASAEGEESNLVAKAWATGTWTAQAMSWGWAADRISEQQTRWNKLIIERKESESRLTSKLKSTDLGPLLSYNGGNTRAGITRHYTGTSVHRSRYLSDPLLQDILSGSFTPQEVADKWKALGLSNEDVKKLPIEVLFALGKADGVPFAVQDIAANAALDYAIANPDASIRMMGLSGDMSVKDFTEQVKNIRQTYNDAVANAKLMSGKPTVQLFGFGSHDGVLTAAISLGNLDTAKHVGVNVSGMGSDVNGLANGLGGAEQLYLEARRYNSGASPAIVAWIGYHSPAMPPSLEVTHGDRAAAGAKPLANFIDGINAVRSASGQKMSNFVVFGHSYGSTTAAEALKITQTEVDTFVTYGSAGLEKGTTVEEMHANHFYATGAKGDNVAWMGLSGSGRDNPVNIPGIEKFESEDRGDRVRVTAHDMFTEDKSGSFFNWGGKVGYLTKGTSSVESMGRILGGGTP
ncbi:alpha/beta hydrolase [Leucobacter sp. UT-8R-CII-1-4]|uniref:alpha/beta hydrolase n=1 Tax=Leucobacter sp. UT-8R-CII-1-4 TaxID=3040075 RepID=UPI0024A924BE|nr:alpha/beta hydrolase [Leucobacter sp. UT-8R-CII-1-4]MDI6023104.1 alpha/beta hydrolase [Leucobacter sp. UT-8R-CII-1-4]